MKKKPYLILFALLFTPVIASSDPLTHIIEDPNPKSQRCQNHISAVHENGDVVSVFYHGQWAKRSIGVGIGAREMELQNGGPSFGSCAVEAIVRIRPDGSFAWELDPSEESRGELGFAKQDKIRSLNTLSDGRTLITTTLSNDAKTLHSMLIMLDATGELLWKKRTETAPAFSLATTFVGTNNELFVSYNFTNFGYKNGIMKLPMGKKWSVRPNKAKTILAKLNTDNGDLEWEKEIELVSAKGNELLTIKTFQKKGTSKYKVQRFSYDGKKKTSFTTPWMRGSLKSVTRFRDNIAFVQSVNILESNQRRVDHRYHQLYILNSRGKMVIKKKLSDHATLAKIQPGAPLRVISPVNLVRDTDYGKTKGLSVYTLEAIQKPATTSLVSLESGMFDYENFSATSTSNGTWIHAVSYFGKEKRPAVSEIFTLDKECKIGGENQHIWRPLKKKKQQRKQANLFF